MKQNFNLRWHILLSSFFLLLYCGNTKAQSLCFLEMSCDSIICAGECANVINTSYGPLGNGDTACFPDFYWTAPGGIPATYLGFSPGCFTFNTPGFYTITLYAVDNQGNIQWQNFVTDQVFVQLPPNAGFTYSPIDPCMNDFVLFAVDDTTLNPNNYITWDFGDANFGSGPTPSNQYQAPGTFTVICCVGNSCDTICTSQIITVHDANPCFTWSGTCRVEFESDTLCDHLIVPGSHFWDFGDQASGANNTSNNANPVHTFTLDNHTYTVTHTITTPNGVLTCTAIVVQQGPPVANIVGYATNNCGNGTITYTANPCDVGITYSWSLLNAGSGTLSNTTGCTTDVNWGANGGYLILAAWDSINDCTGYDTLQIPGCCDIATPYRIDNTSASAVLSSLIFAPCITGPNTINGVCSGVDIVISGVFTIDVPITFLNCDLINMSPNTVVIVNPGQTLTLNNCTTSVKCDTMWDGIYLTNVTSTVNIINGTVIQQAKNGVVSNSGGRYFIENSTFRNNYRDLQVNAYSGTHPGIVRATDFVMTASFWPAIPALPFGHTKTVCAIEITDNADITIGDASTTANRNRFNNILVGVRSNNSNTKVINGRFTNFTPNAAQQFNVPNAGTCIVANGKKSYTYQAAITVGGTGLNKCVFNNMRIGIDGYDNINVTILNNNLSEIRTYGVRLQGCGQRAININDNLLTNAPVAFAFNTGFLLLECYDATVNIISNTILQTNNVSGQVGTGIRVGLVTPGNVTLNIVNNVSIARVRTGILLERLTGKDLVYVTNNAISFSKPNANYTVPHHGVHLVDCGGKVRVEYNIIQKSMPVPTTVAMRNNLRGVTIQNSQTSIVAHNTITRMGTGIYGQGISSNSTLACNTLVRCYDGFYFQPSCDIGDQVINPTNGNPAPTGNSWTSSFNSDINGGIVPGIFWYRDANYTPIVDPLMVPGSLNGAGNTTTLSGNPSACTIIPLFAPPAFDREQNAGVPVLNPTVTPGSEQGYITRQKAHQKLREVPSWMTLGTPQDSLYANFYVEHDNSNIGLFRNFEDMAAVDSVVLAGAILGTIVDTNVSETNLKTVYSIYQLTWMQGVYEFSAADSMTLENIALQPSADAGEAVYAARVMLALQVDDDAPSGERHAAEMEEEVVANTMMIFPNPATDLVMVSPNLSENQSGVVEITDVQGKIVLSKQVTAGSTTLDVSVLDNGLYFVQLIVDGELVETNKLEVIHE